MKGYLTVSMCSSFGDICAPLEDMGTFLAGGRNFTPAVLHTGFKNASSTFKVLSESGNRELFFFRFHDPHGSQQLETVQINFSSNSSSGPGSSSGCHVLVSPMTELMWLVGGFPQSAFAGTPGSLQNGQCTVYTASSKVQYLSPTEVLVRLDVGFGSNFNGIKHLHRSVDGVNWSNPDTASYEVSFSSSNFTDFGIFELCAKSESNPGPCRLRDGLHLVSQPILIRGSGKMLLGQSKFGTVLKRGASLVEPMLSVVSDGGPYFGLVISDLTIDGSRAGASSTGVQDLSVLNVNGGTNPAGGFGIKIENCRFLDSGHSAIAMHPAYPAGPSYTRGIIIRKNEFRRSIRAAVHVSLGSIWWPTAPISGFPQDWGGACDAVFPVQAPTDVLVQNNFFEENDTGAFGVDVSKNVQIRENAMLNNYNNGLDCGGGVVALLSCATNATATGNFIWNKGVYNNPQGCGGAQINADAKDQRAIAPAFEIWGRGIAVQNNWMEYFSNEAMYLTSVYDVTVQQNTVRNASRMYHAKRLPPQVDPDEDDPPGIQVANCNVEEVKRNCAGDDSTCIVKNVTIINNDIRNAGTLGQSYGVRFRNAVCGSYTSGESMTGINVQGNAGVNRQGPSCRYRNLTLNQDLGECPLDIYIGILGLPVQCGTSGCQ